MLEAFWEEATSVPVSCLGRGTDGWDAVLGGQGWPRVMLQYGQGRPEMTRGDQGAKQPPAKSRWEPQRRLFPRS